MESTLAKIAINKTADEALEDARNRVNLGFDRGRVNKSEMASYLLIHAAETLTPVQVEKIRQAHFDPIKYLESLLRKLKTVGAAGMQPEELARLKALTGQGESPKRKAKPAEPDPTERKSAA